MICGARRRWLALRRVVGKATTFMPITRVGALLAAPGTVTCFRRQGHCLLPWRRSKFYLLDYRIFRNTSMSAKVRQVDRPLGRPPFRADHVGSLLRPAALRQDFRRHTAKEIDDFEFCKLQDQYIRHVVAMQEQVGLKVVTDGEFRR